MLTDFRPQRQESIATQFAGLAPDPQQRQYPLRLGEAIFQEIKASSEFHPNNLTYAVAFALAAAVGIQRGEYLMNEESDFLLATVYELLTSDPQLIQQDPAELTALYDTCLLFAGLMTMFYLDAVKNGTPVSQEAAKRLAEMTLQALR
ncbi:MAG: DUF6683 family protein [Cyanobacteriota bacterium]